MYIPSAIKYEYNERLDPWHMIPWSKFDILTLDGIHINDAYGEPLFCKRYDKWVECIAISLFEINKSPVARTMLSRDHCCQECVKVLLQTILKQHKR